MEKNFFHKPRNSSSDITKSFILEDDLFSLFKRKSAINEKFLIELQCTDENFFSIFFYCMSRLPRSRGLLENTVIVKYLNILESFINLLKKNNCNLKDLVSIIANKIEYEFLKKDHILFKYGERGEKYYIILKGKICILVAKDIKFEMTEDEFLKYTTKLQTNDEIELLYRTLLHNLSVFPRVYEKFSKSTEKSRITKSFTTNVSMIPYDLSIKKEVESIKEKRFANVDDYINDNLPCIDLTEDKKRSTVTIFKYFNVVSLKSGDTFGEIALTSSSQKRY